jgi:hypothetical protein
MNDNIRPIPTPEKDEVRAALDAMQRMMPIAKEFLKMDSEIRWTRYQELKAVGFEDKDALYIAAHATFP